MPMEPSVGLGSWSGTAANVCVKMVLTKVIWPSGSVVGTSRLVTGGTWLGSRTRAGAPPPPALRGGISFLISRRLERNARLCTVGALRGEEQQNSPWHDRRNGRRNGCNNTRGRSGRDWRDWRNWRYGGCWVLLNGGLHGRLDRWLNRRFNSRLSRRYGLRCHRRRNRRRWSCYRCWRVRGHHLSVDMGDGEDEERDGGCCGGDAHGLLGQGVRELELEFVTPYSLACFAGV